MLYFQPPSVTCETRIWHPNIGENGEVCLSLLRQNSYDSMGKYSCSPEVIKLFFMLNSAEHEILNAHKY